MDDRFGWAGGVLSDLQKTDVVRTVYDVGAGGEDMRSCAQTLGAVYTAFDLFPRASTTIGWNLEEACPVREPADVVLLLEVVEHLNNPWQAMRNVAAAIRPGGYLVLSTPNPGWSESRLSLLTHGVLTMFTEEDLEINHHVFTPWTHVIDRLLNDVGLTVVGHHPIGGGTDITAVPFWGLKMPFRFIYRVAKRLMERADPRAAGSLQGVVARKKA